VHFIFIKQFWRDQIKMPGSPHLSIWLARRQFSRRKLRNSLITVAVALSVALLVSSNIASQSISSQVVTTVHSVGGDVDLIVSKITSEPFNESLLGVVANNSAIKSQGGIVAPRYSGDCILSGATVPLNLVNIVGVDPTKEQYIGFSNSSLSPLLNGSYAIATDDIAEALSIKNGSEITIGTVLANQTSRSLDLTVVSIAHIEGKGFSSALLVNITQAQWLFATPHEISDIVVKLPNVETTPDIEKELLQSLSPYEVEVTAPKEEIISDTTRLLNGFTLGLDAVAAISLMSAAILTADCLLMAANERRKETGVLRAVGASRGALFKVFMFEGLIHGLVGGSVGIVLGIFISTTMTAVISGFTGYQPAVLLISPLILVLSFVTGIIVTMLGSLYPAFVASRTPPAKAMRLQARERGEKRTPAALLSIGVLFIIGGVYGALSETIWLVEIGSVLLIVLGSLLTLSALTKQVVQGIGVTARPLLRTNRVVTIRNVARNRRRTSLTIGVVSIGLTFVIFIGSVQGSLTYGLNDFMYHQLGTDIMIRPVSSVNVTDIGNIGSVSGVSHFSYCEFYVTRIGPGAPGVIKGDNLTAITGIDTATFPLVSAIDLKPPGPTNGSLVMNELASNNHSIVLSTKLANDLGVSVGENVTVLLENSVHANLTVVALFYGSGFVQYGEVTLDAASFMSFQALTSLFGLPQAIGSIPNKDSTEGLILVKVQENVNPDDVAQRIQNSGLLGPSGSLNIVTSESVTTAFVTTVGEIVLLFQMLLVVSLLVALLGLSAATFMSVMERRRETGILLAIGMSKGDAIRSTLAEALIIGLAGLLLGFINSLLLSLIFIEAVSSFGLYLPYIFPYTEVLIAIVLTLLISLLSGAYPARLTSKLKIVDAIRYE
jgi:putative ABC transport system permease protein